MTNGAQLSAPTPWRRTYAWAVVVFALTGGGLVGCAQALPVRTADASATGVTCGGSTNIYEPSAEAGLPTAEEALEHRIEWLAKAVEEPPRPDPDGEGTFSLLPELHTMEVALAALKAGRHVERKTFGDRESSRFRPLMPPVRMLVKS